MKVLFKEEQKMKQWWLWVILIGITLLPIYGLIQQVVFDTPFGNKPAPSWTLAILLLFMIGMIYFFYSLNLKTTITKDHLHIDYSILANKKIAWKDVNYSEVIKYNFVGYGLRYSRKYGTVYNASGNMGLLIKTKFGKFVAGTKQPDELTKVLKQVTNESPKESTEA